MTRKNCTVFQKKSVNLILSFFFLLLFFLSSSSSSSSRSSLLLFPGICMSRSMTKPPKWHVRPAKTKSDQSSLSAWRKLESSATNWAHNGCPDWSESLPAAQSFCWFCHEVAHMSLPVISDQDTPSWLDIILGKLVFRWKLPIPRI